MSQIRPARDFRPAGFTRDGSRFVWHFKMNDQGRFAVFALNGVSAASMPESAASCRMELRG